MGVMHGLSNMDSHSPRQTWEQPCWVPKLPTAESVAHSPRVISQLPGGRLITLDHSFPSWKGQGFLLLGIDIYSRSKLAFSAETTIIDLQNAFFIILVYHTALLLIKKRTLQLMKCSNEHRIMEFAIFSISPTIPKQLALYNVEMVF